MFTPREVSEVFGINTEVSEHTYVNRSDLDSKLQNYLRTNHHIIIRGDSKTGKSWLRQRILENPIVIQCRLNMSLTDIYKATLSSLGIKLLVSEQTEHSFTGELTAETEFGTSILAKVAAKLGLQASTKSTRERIDLTQGIDNLKYVAELINESHRRLVIEDFHYLNEEVRTQFAFDLKTMWDYKCYVIIIGVWAEDNLLLRLNEDLLARTREVIIRWNDADLKKILDNGCNALNLELSPSVISSLVSISYGNAGILQRLTQDALMEAGITESTWERQRVHDHNCVESAALYYAEELNTVYQNFAKKVSSGIRTRKNSTGIYAHALAVILESTDEELKNGIPVEDIFSVAHQREPRIQLGNLKTALEKIERLQVDDNGQGLVLSFANEKVRLVDYQLLLYRRFSTVKWPWEDLIREAEKSGETFDTV